MEYDLEFVDLEKIAQSMTNGMADCNFFLWVPEWLQDDEEKEYLVLKNTETCDEENYEVLYHFTAEYIRNKCCYALSPDGRFALAGYAAKKGVICYDCESGKVLWNNSKIKKIHEMRFNNFDSNIIEVINDKLEITYLDKLTGEALEQDKIKQVRQVINWMRASKNGKYLLAADVFSSKDKAIYTVYDTESGNIKGRFVAQNQMNTSTFDITNDGAFAVCSAYQKQGISLIKVETGEILWTQKLKKISAVYFDKEDAKVVVCCQCDGVYVIDRESGITLQKTYDEGMARNTYGEDIKFEDRNIVKIGGKQIKSSSFAFLEAVGTPRGVALNPVGNGLLLYDAQGNFLWNNAHVNIGNLVYQEETGTICGFDYISGQEKIVILSGDDGKVVAEMKIADCACAYIHNNKTLLCNTGKMYDVSKKQIREKTEVFLFCVES